MSLVFVNQAEIKDSARTEPGFEGAEGRDMQKMGIYEARLDGRLTRYTSISRYTVVPSFTRFKPIAPIV